METDALTFQVYAPARGNALTVDGDGELALRLAVPAADRDAVLELLDALRAGEGTCIRLVAVRGDV